MATETKKTSKVDEVLNKIDAFFSSLMSAKKADDEPEEDDDMEEKKAKKADDDEDAKDKSAKTKKAKKATDEEDSQDPDNDEDDDPDKDDDKDMKKKDAEIKRLTTLTASQNVLLEEAREALAERDTTVRETIKSTFKPQGSQRSTKIGVKGELPSWAQPTTDMGKRATKMAASKK